MNKNLNFSQKEGSEGTYEQFDTDETSPQEKKHKKIKYFSTKQILKYILITFIALCVIFLLFNLSQDKSFSNTLESKLLPKNSKLPLEKDELNIMHKLKFIEKKINLDSSIKGTAITNGNEQIILINVFITINNICPKENCFDCYSSEEINYPELSENEAFDKVYKEMGLRDTFVKNVYCQQHNPEMPKGVYTNQVHFVWNKYKRKMMPIKGLYFINERIAKTYNNEYLQSLMQGYEFTIIDHIYEKNNKNYRYNDITLKFDEIKLDIKCQKIWECSIGSDEKCSSCDSNQNKYCDSCNEGYYLSEDDKTRCKKFERDGDEINYQELSDKEAFDKVYKEMRLHNTNIRNIFYQLQNTKNPKNNMIQKYYVWNNYKRKMIPIKGLNYIDEDIAVTYNNEYLQSVIQGYEFTFMDHIYKKDNKFYNYNDITLKFDEIKFD